MPIAGSTLITHRRIFYILLAEEICRPWNDMAIKKRRTFQFQCVILILLRRNGDPCPYTINNWISVRPYINFQNNCPGGPRQCVCLYRVTDLLTRLIL